MRADRRGFLKLTGSLAVAAAAPTAALASSAQPGTWATRGGYGPLRPVADETTGLNLLDLPEGFRYLTLGWTGDPMEDGQPTPARHDGMAVVASEGDRLILIRNHEIANDRGSFAPPEITYDPAGGGGTTSFEFDVREGRLVRTWVSLGGTLQNCCGGPTPWGSWMTCEEAVINPGYVFNDGGQRRELGLKKQHGFVFDVPARGPASAEPIVDMGQFSHEAVAVDPRDGVIYETEDRHPEAGFYRFLPNDTSNPAAGGRLQMMRVEARPEMRIDVPLNQPFDVTWVDIDDPSRGHTPGTEDMSGVVRQGLRKGGAQFIRLEGCWYADGQIYFTATSGGQARKGQIFSFDPVQQTVQMIYESPDEEIMNYPDNLTVSPNGCVVLCEDGSRSDMMMLGLTPAGQVFPLARNRVILSGEKNGIAGHYTGSEWCGACFSPDGRWLFANIQKPGITVAITGPWDDGVI